jgi:cold shock protein
MEGTIARIVVDRGFGFVQSPDSDRDLFFHAKDLVGLDFDELLLERRVQFEVEQTDRGPRARRIRPL